MIRPVFLLLLLFAFSGPAVAGDEREGETVMLREWTLEWALDALVDADPEKGVIVLEAERETVLEMFERAHEAGDLDGRWAAGLSLVFAEMDDPERAYDWAKKAVEAEPDVAVNHYALANAAGVMTQDAGLLSKGKYASVCKKSYIRAVELDPDLFPARVGLTMYYAFAPGIAGGSRTKAYEQADAIVAMSGREVDGWKIKAMIAAQKEDWEIYRHAMSSALPFMESNRETDLLRTQDAYTILTQMKDPSAAMARLLEVIDEGVKREPFYVFVRARTHYSLAEFREAATWFERVIEIVPDAEKSQYYLGESAMELKDYEKARDAFARYLENAPKGKHAKKAKKGLKKAKLLLL